MEKRDFPPIHPGEILLCGFLLQTFTSQYRLAYDIGAALEELLDRLDKEVHPFSKAA
jgi:hypothetical protein